MRKVIDLQMEFWKKDIANIEFDLASRNEIPKLMMRLQYIYSTPLVREIARRLASYHGLNLWTDLEVKYIGQSDETLSLAPQII